MPGQAKADSLEKRLAGTAAVAAPKGPTDRVARRANDPLRPNDERIPRRIAPSHRDSVRSHVRGAKDESEQRESLIPSYELDSKHHPHRQQDVSNALNPRETMSQGLSTNVLSNRHHS